MSQVCNWLTVFSCMRGTPKYKLQQQIHPGRPGHFDAVIVWKGKENKKSNSGGLAYDVILKPAAGDLPRPSSPPKDKGLTHEDIVRKLQEAEERRLSMEAEKLAPIAKMRERAQEAIERSQQENEEFSRATQEKLRRSMEVNKENRDAQIQALQTRLREHEKHVEEVVKANEALSRSKYSEEKVLEKIQKAIQNRESFLEEQKKRLQEHEKKIEEVRNKKAVIQSSGDCSPCE
ncbi:stathmin-like isoform X4 [Dreissena polymorpha]|uniref:stathmin-like isoform X4 n=1 Tax=Dreissena polymorpha TaxID=45954 RepID=UPI0022653D7D|nr:stathmin-like isoform X4 [Dreissena polymorpha]